MVVSNAFSLFIRYLFRYGVEGDMGRDSKMRDVTMIGEEPQAWRFYTCISSPDHSTYLSPKLNCCAPDLRIMWYNLCSSCVEYMPCLDGSMESVNSFYLCCT